MVWAIVPCARWHLTCAVLSAGGFALSACTPVTTARPPVSVDFTVPPDEPTFGRRFLDTPWPSDLMVTADGLDLSTFPNPSGASALEEVIQLFQTASGYSATGTLFFHVPGGVDESSLPVDARASLRDDAALFIVETTTLRRIPAEWMHYREGTGFLPPGSVAVQPLLGALPRGRFAVVVTSRGRAADGSPLGPSPDLMALMTCGALPDGARAVDCAPYRALVAGLGLAPADVALIQMVTPVDATLGLTRAAQVLRALPPPEATITAKRASSGSNAYAAYDGTVALAQFQAGMPPYDTLDGVSGGFVIDASGMPVPQGNEDVPFLLTVPQTPMPPEGYCVVVNGHGTGGDLDTPLGDGPRAEAWQVARAGCATLSVSEPLHRTRRGYRVGQEEILTFNFFNPLAGRDNWRQSALEKMQLITLAEHLRVSSALTGGAEVRLDPRRVSFLGHSQGGIVGALVVAVDERLTGAFLSGAGAGFQASLVEKTDPIAIADVLRQLLSLPAEEPIDRFHPVIALLQTWVDPADPINYGPLWRERDGPVAHIVMTSGLLDTFTPKRCHGALAASFHVPLVDPVAEPVDVLDLLGLRPAAPPISGNLRSANGTPLTAGVLQYPRDGHFAVYNNSGAQSALADFFSGLQRGTPTVRVE